MEYQYKLNLPPLEDILMCNISDMVTVKSNSSFTIHDPKQCLKPEWLTLKNFNWNLIYLFYKANSYRGAIHNDTQKQNQPWGINWISGGDGIFEYWNMDNIIDTGTKLANIHGDKVIHFNTNKLCEKVYEQKSGNAYLVNGYHPHRATGYDKRYSFSLRSTDDFCIEWEDVVNKFQDMII